MATTSQTRISRRYRLFRHIRAGSRYPEAARAHYEQADCEMKRLREVTAKVIFKACHMRPFPRKAIPLTEAVAALVQARAACRKVETRYHHAVSDYLYQRVEVDASVTRILSVLSSLAATRRLEGAPADRPFEQDGLALEGYAAQTPAQLITLVPILVEAIERRGKVAPLSEGTRQELSALGKEVGVLNKAHNVLQELFRPFDDAVEERKVAMQGVDQAFLKVKREATKAEQEELLLDKGVVLSLDMKRTVASLFFEVLFGTRKILQAADRFTERFAIRHVVVRRALLGAVTAAAIGGAGHYGMHRSHPAPTGLGVGIERN